MTEEFASEQYNGSATTLAAFTKDCCLKNDAVAANQSVAHWLTKASPPRVFSCVSSWNMRYATYDDLSMGPHCGFEVCVCVSAGMYVKSIGRARLSDLRSSPFVVRDVTEH